MIQNLRNTLSLQDHVLKNPTLPKSAVLVAVTAYSENPSLVLTRRAKHLSRNPGEVCFPGGKWEAHDVSLLATALRETQEEIGLVPEQVEILGSLKPLVARTGLNVAPFVGLIDADLFLEPTSDELDCVFKVPLRFFMDQKNVTPYLFVYQGAELSFPSFVYEGFTVWGLTAYIIVDLINLVYDAGIELPFK